MISMTEIKDLADEDSDLKKAIDKYDDVQDYKVYLIGKNRVMVVTDVIFQGTKGYVYSDVKLEGGITVTGLGFDNDGIIIVNRVEDSNLYYFSAGM
ncbi:MAG: hypothetical protein K6E27_03465 [Eubacterium sp.]|nr:hypothetical protein [Eubacterium sp.]